MAMSMARGAKLVFGRVSVLKERLFSPKNLLYTNVGISIFLSGAGDVIEQHYEILKGQWDRWSFTRTRNMAISGMSIGILCHYWYNFLDAKMIGRTLALLENSSLAELKEEIRTKAHRLYIAEWIIWPPAQIINFYFLPTRYRVLYDNTISLGYDIYTSHVKHNT
ncbi:PREDICTED: mpv17-like protein 2 isoform X3 [Dinoponera quadriceps]|uniref:Mpv17-like protein 2 isoform X3 n=1 Tax=Dinoponera quadriceps TaxID=609295 RepID=A0A6P3YAX2_DINQU|nr:PREDICTED: mpv17-like protein 2 isoform X3 [Dinoponera quadriceps]